MGNAFVSIDIDFWNPLNHTSLRPYLDQLTALCRGRYCIPLSAVTNHQQMLPLVNASGATRLVNLDTHSDLADPTAAELSCGTWVGYCKARQVGHYHWIHADTHEKGECNGEWPIFRPRGVDHDLTDWELVTHERVRRAPALDKLLNGAVAVCVCSSPSYSYDGLLDQFTAWRKEHAIPYRKGRLDEHFGRKATPPSRKSLTRQSSPALYAS